MRGGDRIASDQNQEHKHVRDEKQRNDESWNEVRGLQHTRYQPGSIALIEGVEKIGSAPKIECPDHRDADPAAQSSQRKQGQQRSNEIAICGWQFGRNDTLHQECEPDKSETVQEEERTQGISARLGAE